MATLPHAVNAEQLAALCRRHRVSELAVFGSVARGDARLDSDLDLLIDFEPGARIGFIALAQLTRELQDLFERPVDVVTKRGLHPRIRAAVLAEAEVLFAA
ncbi:MAG TPA: nucleotidyltransferase domain-containing protein [Phycisphaerae bacterium]|nr:nucleotidyltransferase domain-containing protein [Phycisphaerae bacterium]